MRWDDKAQATPNGQLVFFTEFLAATGIFDHWVQSCPLSYTSPNAPTKLEVLGTLLLGIMWIAKAAALGHVIAQGQMKGLLNRALDSHPGTQDPKLDITPVAPHKIRATNCPSVT